MPPQRTIRAASLATNTVRFNHSAIKSHSDRWAGYTQHPEFKWGDLTIVCEKMRFTVDPQALLRVA
jgi:hypothetical protein